MATQEAAKVATWQFTWNCLAEFIVIFIDSHIDIQKLHMDGEGMALQKNKKIQKRERIQHTSPLNPNI